MDDNKIVKECIASLQKLLSDQNFAADCSTSEDLCQLLCDGEILCTVLTQLSNGRISNDEGTYCAMTSDFMARSNLEFFRAQCQEEFGFKEDEVFEPDDLLQMSNPKKVISTIQKLLHGRYAEASKLRRQSTVSIGKCVIEKVIKEICDHERALVDKLTKLLLYRTELLGLLSEWSEDFVKVVFSHTEQLCVIHTELHKRLTALADQGCEQFCTQLSTLFQDMAPKLEVYKEYFSHLPVANARMEEEFKRDPRQKHQLGILDKHFGKSECSLMFRALFDAPIRQLTSYLLLYKRLQEAAKKEVPYLVAHVDEAIAKASDLLDRANEYKRQAEQLSVTKRILGQISDLPNDLSDPAVIGLHLADDCFRVKTVKDRKVESQACDCLLTTKQLIFSTKSQKKESMSMFAFNIPVVDIQEVTKNDKSFCLEIIQVNGDKAVIESTKRKNETLAKWKKVLDETRAENKPLGWNSRGHRFELKTLPQGTPCTKCKLALPGSYLQGYSCSHCDKVLHRECFRLAVPFPASYFDHANIERGKADELLSDQPEGAFLIRDSRIGGKALSIKAGGKDTKHINVKEGMGKFSLGPGTPAHNSLDDLIDFYRENKMSMHFTTMEFSLSNGIEARRGN